MADWPGTASQMGVVPNRGMWPGTATAGIDYAPGSGSGLVDASRFTFWCTRSRFPSGSLVVAAADTPYKMSRIVLASPSYAKRNPRLHFSGFASTEGGNSPQETVLPGNATIIDGVWISVNGGAPVALTFNGQPGVTIASGSAGAWTDEPNIAIPAEASVAVHTLYHTAAAENQIPVYRIQTARGERIWGATDAASLMGMLNNPSAASTASLDTGFGQSMPAYYGPDMTVARGWDGKPVVIGMVDSIGEQRQEFAVEADARGGLGWLRKWLDQPDPTYGRVPFFMMGMPGVKSAQELNTSALLRWQVLDQANAFNGDGSLVWTKPISQLGQNDLQSTYAATQTVYTGLLDRFAARYPSSPKPVGVGVFPRTTSTDQYTTRAGQTASTGNEWANGAAPWGAGIKYQLEAYKQAGAGGRLIGYIDTRPAYLNPAPPAGQSPATWAPAFSTSLAAAVGTDGTATYSQISVVAKPSLGDLLYMPGGANFVVSKIEGTGPYLLTTNSPIATVLAAMTPVIARPTPDGVHLLPSYVTAAVAAIPQSQKAQLA